MELPLPHIAVHQEVEVPDPNTPSLSGTRISVLHTSVNKTILTINTIKTCTLFYLV